MRISERPLPKTGYCRLSQILSVIPISKSRWYDLVKEKKAPQPIRLGERTAVYKSEEIHAFIESLDNREAA